eukprot:4570601-Amphidinium_carterae.1
MAQHSRNAPTRDPFWPHQHAIAGHGRSANSLGSVCKHRTEQWIETLRVLRPVSLNLKDLLLSCPCGIRANA